VPASDLAQVDLLMVMRIYASESGGHTRRVVSVHRLGERDGELVLTPLVSHDADTDSFTHDADAELALLGELRHEDSSAASAALEKREKLLDDLGQRNVLDIPEVRAAIAADRGERALMTLRGDPVNG